MINKRKIIIFLFFILALYGLHGYAQRTSVNATISPAEILIGEHATITLDIKAPKGRNILTPEFNPGDTLISGIEVLAKLKPDTTISHEVMSISQQYIVTSFDSALYNIPYIPIIDGVDTIYSQNFGLKVSSVILPDSVMAYLEDMKTGKTDSIDFSALQLTDIKDIQEVPFSFWDFLISFIYEHPFIFLISVFLIIFILAITAFIILSQRKKKKGYYFKPEVVLPPHIVALQMLEKIKSENLCRQGLEKQYYTELSDALRIYIEKRYYIRSLEQTSDETIEAVDNFVHDEEVMNKLKEVLKLSDLVKFAKYKPSDDENVLSMNDAYNFINKTKEEVVENNLSQNQPSDKVHNVPLDENRNINEDAER